MANNRELTITLTAMTAPLTSGLSKAAGEIRGFANTAVAEIEKITERGEGMKNLFKDFIEAFAAVEIVDGLVKIAEAASRATDELEIAARVSKNFGKDFDVAEMDSWLQKLARSAEGGGFSIMEMRDAVQQLATTGASETQQQRLLVDVLGLAAAKHISVAEATHLAVMASEGHLEALSRVGIATHDAAGNLLSYSQIMANWESEIAGAAEKRANGLEGAFGRLATSVNQLMVAFGSGLIPIVTAAANAIGALAGAIAKLPSWILNTVGAVSALLLGFTALGLAMPAVVKAFDFLKNGVLIAVDVIGGMAKLVRNLPAIFNAARVAIIATKDALLALDIAALIMEAPFWAIVAAIGAIVAIVAEATRGFQDLKNLWAWFMSTPLVKNIEKVLFPKVDSIGKQGAKLDGHDKPDQKGIDDWLTEQKAAIEAAVEFSTERVAKAQAKLEETTAKLEELRAKRDPAKPLGPGSAAEEQRLITEQIQRQRALQGEIARQRDAELKKAQQLRALAAADATKGDKDAVKHGAELTQEASKATIEALKLLSVFDKMGGTIAQLGRAMREALLKPIRESAAFAAIARDLLYGQHTEGLRHSSTMEQFGFERQHVFRPATPVEQAERTAQVERDEADQKKLELEQAKALSAALDKDIHDGIIPATEAAKQRADMDLRVSAAMNAEEEARTHHAVTIAEINELQKERAGRDRKEILDKTAGRIPGVTTTAAGGLGAFNWGSVFADAIAQSHAFANVMQLVNEIMSVFTQIFESLEPIIDSLLTVIAMLVNGFISLWNMIARLVGILGIHLQQLEYINTVFNSGTTNMVTFFHDIPTLNELASGNVGPLGPETSSNPLIQIHYDLTNMQNAQQGWFGSILGDLALLGAIDWLTGGKFLSGIPIIGNLFQNVGNFLKTGIDSLGQLFVNGWNGLQNWMMTNLGQVGAGIFNIAAGAALLSTHDTGVAGFLEKILGVLEIIQGIAQLFGSGSIFGAGGILSGLLGSGGGGGIGGALSGLFGGGSGGAASFGTWGAAGGAAAAALGDGITVDAFGNVVDVATGNILVAAAGAPTDVAFSGGGAGLGGGGGGSAAGGSALGSMLTAAGVFAAPFLLSTLFGSGFMGIGSGAAPNNVAVNPGAMQSGANWTGNSSTVNQAPQTVYSGGYVGETFNPQYGSNASGTGGLGQQLDDLLQTPLANFSAAVQPLIQQLITYANQMTSTMMNDQGLPSGQLVPIIDANGVVEGYTDASGNATGYNLATLLGAVGSGARPSLSGMTGPLNALVDELLTAIGGGDVSGAVTAAVGTQIAGTRTAQSIGSGSGSGGATVNGGINVTLSGVTVNGYNDVQDMASDLATLTLQSLSQNAYALNRVPSGSTLLPA